MTHKTQLLLSTELLASPNALINNLLPSRHREPLSFRSTVHPDPRYLDSIVGSGGVLKPATSAIVLIFAISIDE